MDNNKLGDSDELHPGDFELGSIESRAAARAILHDPTAGMKLITQFVGTRRDSDGRLLGPDFDFTRASIGDKLFERGENETLAAFEARVGNELPAIGVALATFWCDRDDDAGRPTE